MRKWNKIWEYSCIFIISNFNKYFTTKIWYSIVGKIFRLFWRIFCINSLRVYRVEVQQLCWLFTWFFFSYRDGTAFFCRRRREYFWKFCEKISQILCGTEMLLNVVRIEVNERKFCRNIARKFTAIVVSVMLVLFYIFLFSRTTAGYVSFDNWNSLVNPCILLAL